MITSFADQGSEDIYDGKNSKAARGKLPRNLWVIAQRKLGYLRNARQLADLRSPPGNQLEELRGAHRGRYSIRINEQYRIVFTWEGSNAANIWVGDYHDSL